MLLFLLTALAAATVKSGPVASLQVRTDGSTFSVVVNEDASVGYRLHIKCIAECVRSLSYQEVIGDTPLGLFSDEMNLVFSLSVAGSGYRVRVWHLTNDG